LCFFDSEFGIWRTNANVYCTDQVHTTSDTLST
jgi:hypothetical protein